MTTNNHQGPGNPWPSARRSRRLAALCLAGLLLLQSGCAAFSSDPRVRTPGTIFDDNVLEGLVKRRIRESDPGFRHAHLVVTAYDGTVLLVGQVESDTLRQKATEVARGIAKVERVHNELEIGGPTSLLARSNDGWLTAKVKTQLLRSDDAAANTIKVQTENGVVYLMGTVPRSEADAAVAAARSVYGVQKIVKVFDYAD